MKKEEDGRSGGEDCRAQIFGINGVYKDASSDSSFIDTRMHLQI